MTSREPELARHAGHRAARIAATAGIPVLAGAFVHLVPGVVAWRSARCRLLPQLSGVGRPDHVALTFDDGPDPKSTPAIVDCLEALGWRATFFCLGSQVERAPSLARELVERGHEVGVHGQTHRSQLLRAAPAVIADVGRARSLLEDTTGSPVEWFRPPYGGVSASTLTAARWHSLRTVLWTTWGLDWRADATGATVAGHVARTYYPGATVLLHDSDITSTPRSWKATLAALPRLAEDWQARGLSVGPLRDHF